MSNQEYLDFLIVTGKLSVEDYRQIDYTLINSNIDLKKFINLYLSSENNLSSRRYFELLNRIKYIYLANNDIGNKVINNIVDTCIVHKEYIPKMRTEDLIINYSNTLWAFRGMYNDMDVSKPIRLYRITSFKELSHGFYKVKYDGNYYKMIADFSESSKRKTFKLEGLNDKEIDMIIIREDGEQIIYKGKNSLKKKIDLMIDEIYNKDTKLIITVQSTKEGMMLSDMKWGKDD